MVNYIFVSRDTDEVRELERHFVSRELPVEFSTTIPLIRIPGLDAIHVTVMGYERLAGGISVRTEFRETLVRKSTAEMRERGLPPYVIVGR